MRSFLPPVSVPPGTLRNTNEHVCQWVWDESDYRKEIECYGGCGQSMKVVMGYEGDLALQYVD